VPEAPDLEVIKEFLNQRLLSVKVESARVLKPLVLRNLTQSDFSADILERSFVNISRKGKFLVLDMSGGRLIVINPMLAGGLQYCTTTERTPKSVYIVLSLSNGSELRYFDTKQMGMVYYLEPGQIAQVPRINEQGPDVLDEPMPLQDFSERLRKHQGEIKGILTSGRFASGIGNTYSDEILFAAGILPFKKRAALSNEEVKRLHEATYSVTRHAVEVLRERVGTDIHKKIRDFLLVHGKGGQPCPRCGSTITHLTANQRITDYCRNCQPGTLHRN